MSAPYLPSMSGGGLPEDSPANDQSESIADIVPDPVKMAEIAPQVLEALRRSSTRRFRSTSSRWGSSTTCSSTDGRVGVRMTLTAPACPAAQSLPVEVRDKAKAVEGVTDAKVEIVWDPPWTKERMSDAAKLQLGML